MAQRPTRQSLTLDRPQGELDDTASSPSSVATTNSPLTPFTTLRPMSASSGSETHPEEDKIAPLREKRKRSRVTPEQLVRLEHFFALDRSPTASRRREISALLNMQERQTQIWFQNRRAKAKQIDAKQLKSRPRLTTSLSRSPESSQLDYQLLVHEDAPFSLISCKDISIGTWRRVISLGRQEDLVAYACFPKRYLTWFIHSGGFGFKMEIPFNTITDAEFVESSPGNALVIFTLSEAPLFHMETTSQQKDGTAALEWTRSTDWTEATQASTVLRHELGGDAAQLNHFLLELQPFLLALTSPPTNHPSSGRAVEDHHQPISGYHEVPRRHSFEIASPQPTGYSPGNFSLDASHFGEYGASDSHGSPSRDHGSASHSSPSCDYGNASQSAPPVMTVFPHPPERSPLTASTSEYSFSGYNGEEEQYPLSAYPDVNISGFARGYHPPPPDEGRTYYNLEPHASGASPYLTSSHRPRMDLPYSLGGLDTFSPNHSVSPSSLPASTSYQSIPSPLV